MIWIKGKNYDPRRCIKLQVVKTKRKMIKFYGAYYDIIDLACIVFGIVFGFILSMTFFI